MVFSLEEEDQLLVEENARFVLKRFLLRKEEEKDLLDENG